MPDFLALSLSCWEREWFNPQPSWDGTHTANQLLCRLLLLRNLGRLIFFNKMPVATCCWPAIKSINLRLSHHHSQQLLTNETNMANICIFLCVFVYLGDWLMGCRVGLQSHRGRAGPAGTRAAPAWRKSCVLCPHHSSSGSCIRLSSLSLPPPSLNIQRMHKLLQGENSFAL